MSRMPEASPLLLINIGQLLSMRSTVQGPRRGASLSDLGLLKDASVLTIGGKIVSVGSSKEALRDPWLKKNRTKVVEFDCKGQVVLPGFVDSHTHPVFMSPRLIDFEQRIAGCTYEEIAAAGGGIRSSIEDVRNASKAVLAQKVLHAFREMAEYGTTTVEAKSGYGLSLESELKSLEAIKTAAAQWPGSVVSTLLGAHVIPSEYKECRGQYVVEVCEKMIPQAAQRNLAQFVDVFCDKGAFTPDESEKILAAAQTHGLAARAHLCQLSETRLAPFLKYEPASLDHMDYVNEEDIRNLAKSPTVATFVPGANYFLGLKNYPPARKLIDAGVAIAIATDYNPGTAPTLSMPFALSLACTHMKMSPAEAITAATVNGAHSLRIANRKGSIEPGKDADLAVFDVKDYREIAYWVAARKCVCTVLNGYVDVSSA